MEREDDRRETTDELVVTRLFDAPRGRVFQMWTESERLAEWWGPNGFTAPVCEIEPHPGGRLHIDMLGPDGVLYPCRGSVREINAPERLVFSSGLAAEDDRLRFEVLSSVTFVEQDTRTLVSLQARIIRADPD